MADSTSCGKLTITEPTQMQGNSLLAFVAVGLIATVAYTKYRGNS